MKVVPLVSGGLDSTVMSVLIADEGLEQFPVFVNYGQLNRLREREACIANFSRHGLRPPVEVELEGYGAAFPSGLTDRNLEIVRDAFLPGRNLLFLLCGAAHAYKVGADAVSIGLLSEEFSIFPDQKRSFLDQTEALLSIAMGRAIKVLAPLMSFSKAEVLAIAKEKGVSQSYSCHAGAMPPCGQCIACREYTGLEM